MSHVSPSRDPGRRRAPRLSARAAFGLALVLVLVGGVAFAAFAAGGTPPGLVAGVPSSSPVALATEPGASQPAASPEGPSPSPVASGPSSDPASPPPAPLPTAEPSASPAVPGESIPSGSLQARLDAVRARLKIPGVTVAILWDDGRQWMGASGLRDVAANEPMTTGTALALASISKTVTAGVVLQLVDEGKLGLDDRVAPLLPGFGLHPKMTVRQLLDHTSGLPDYFLNVKIDRPLQRAPDATWTAKQAMAFEPKKRPAPDRFWIYSNANYLLLGELVQRVTGRSLAVEVRDRLLTPLGLEQAWYQGVEKPRAPGAVAYRVITGSGGKTRFVPVAPASDVMPFRSVVTAAGGAGSMAATALDTARWMRAWAGGRVLSPALQAEMLGDVFRTSQLGARIPYGLGIQAVPIAGRYALGHSGRFLGVRNVARYLPGEGVTIAVLTNQSVKDPAKVATALLKVILPPLPTAKPVPGAKPTPKPSAGATYP
jgi:D-alanyl-D-alanine carboxypeptidase